MALALWFWFPIHHHLDPVTLASFCLGYLALLLLATHHQVFPAVLWTRHQPPRAAAAVVSQFGQICSRADIQAAVEAVTALGPERFWVEVCRWYLACVFWGVYLQRCPRYLSDEFAFSHATLGVMAFSIAFIHALVCWLLQRGEQQQHQRAAAATQAKKVQ